MANGKCGKNLTWQLDGNGTLTISGTGDMDDYLFDGMCSPWYSAPRLIKSVVIADGVTSIGEDAFGWCDNLTSVTIPDGVEVIGEHTFSCCGLTSVTIPDSVEKIGKYAFHNCKNLTSVTIPASVKDVGSGAFYGCTNLRKISYPAGAEFDWELSSGNNAELIPY